MAGEDREPVTGQLLKKQVHLKRRLSKSNHPIQMTKHFESFNNFGHYWVMVDGDLVLRRSSGLFQ